jgi:uncharacterized membrane protein (DUF373 family)
MNLKRIVVGFLGLFNPLEIIPFLLDFLEDQAAKTPTMIDDSIVAAMRAAAIQIWPDLFD